jgi:D-alanyl-lipoteichoic acid acyltransferase DltB (MBOAT superfamily)
MQVSYSVPNFDIVLPIGISFYTLQSIGYLIDVYLEKRSPEKHFGFFSVFISYFPLLIAGPIERSENLIPQFGKKNPFLFSNISHGVKFIIWGFFLKLVVADRAAIYVNPVFDNISRHSGMTFIAAAILFSFQIYCDFAGYSYIAIGSSRLLGFNLTMNFNRPYFSHSIHEFWKRWHISLSTWLGDYIYAPLSIHFRHYKIFGILISIFITFLISGLWHGSNWTFLFWGMLHGLYLISEAAFFKKRRRNLLNISITFLQVSFAWIFFRANSVDDAFFIINRIFTYPGNLFISSGEDIVTQVYAVFAIGILVLLEFKKEFFPRSFSALDNKYELVRMTSYALMIFMILYFGVFSESQFLYFKF